MPAGIKANSDGSAAIQVGGTDVITLTSGGAATFVTSPTTVQAGTAAAPSITFSGDTNTGIYSPGADTVGLTAGGTLVGSVGLGTTLALQGATSQSGTGITFPATQSASSNANTLDDYEEGTFSPFISDGTNNTATGTGVYTKIGRAVSVQIQIYNVTYTGLTAGSLLRLSGLPFAVNSTCNAPLSFSLSTYQCLMTQNAFSGTTALGLYATAGTTVDWQNATRTLLGGTAISIYASFVYYT